MRFKRICCSNPVLRFLMNINGRKVRLSDVKTSLNNLIFTYAFFYRLSRWNGWKLMLKILISKWNLCPYCKVYHRHINHVKRWYFWICTQSYPQDYLVLNYPAFMEEFYCKALFYIALKYLYAISYLIFNYGLIFAFFYYAHYKVFYLSMCLNSYI